MLPLKRIILGCGNFGGIGSEPSLYGKGENEEEARQLLDYARDLGIFYFDTANTYGGGRSEEFLGKYLRSQSKEFRSRTRIATKVGNPFGLLSGNAPLSIQEIQFHLDQSLRRLGVEAIDTYYVHEPDPRTPLEETITALSQAMSEGKILSIGFSNVSIHYIQSFLSACDSNLRKVIRFVQNEFHFLKQSDSSELIPFLSARGISYVAFSPLAGGLLTGKYKLNEPPPENSRISFRPEPYMSYCSTEGFAKIDTFLRAARDNGFSPAEAALRFVLGTPGVQGVVIGPRRKEHFVDLGFK